MRMNTKRILAGLLALLMVLAMMPSLALAEGDVCKIGETGYASLEAAISNVQEGNTITLLTDLANQTAGLTKNNTGYTIDLNGKSLGMKPTGYVLNVASGKTVTIKNGIFGIDGSNMPISSSSCEYLIGVTNANSALVFDAVNVNVSNVKGYNSTSQMYLYVFNLDDGYIKFENGTKFKTEESPLIFYAPSEQKGQVSIKDSEFITEDVLDTVFHCDRITIDNSKVNIDDNSFGHCKVTIKNSSEVEVGKTYAFWGQDMAHEEGLSVDATSKLVATGYTVLGTVTISENADVKFNDNVKLFGNTTIANGKFLGSLQKGAETIGISITGGYYKEDVTTFCAIGYECVPNKEVTGCNYKVQKKAPVAQIGTTKYETLAAALTAAKTGTTEEEKTITVIGAAEACVINDCSGITIQGSETGKIVGYLTSDAAASNLKGFKLKDVKFEKGGIVLSTNVTSVEGMKIEDCTFDGTGTDGSQTAAIQLNKGSTVKVDGLTISDNVIKNYTATNNSGILLNGVAPSDNGIVIINRNEIENVNFNAIQALSIEDLTIAYNKIAKIGHTEKAINVSGSEAIIFDNEISLKAGQSAVGSVTKTVSIIGNKITEGTEPVSDYERFALVSAGGTAVLSSHRNIEDGKIYGGMIIKNSTETPSASELAKDCTAAKIGKTLYLVGVDAAANNYKLTGGLYIENPVAFVKDGYGVKASSDKTYRYEVYKTESPQKEIVVEQKTEPGIDPDTVAPEEAITALAVASEADVTGVADALTEDGKDKLIKDAQETNEDLTDKALKDAKQIDISITVEATAVEVKTTTASKESEQVLTFELTPYAVVTAIAADGSEIQSDRVLVENDYLSRNKSEPITVVLGTTFKPEQVLHIRENGEIDPYTEGKKASYENKTYVYADAADESSTATVTLQILDFSEVKILATALPEYTVTFDAAGGTGTMASRKIVKGGAFVLPENGFTAPSGKKFVSWTIGDKTYNAGDKITVTKNITVKATWETVAVTADFSTWWPYILIGFMGVLALSFGITRLSRKED